VASLTCTRDGRALVGTGADQAIVWDVARRAVAAARAGDEDRVVDRVVSADGARLAEVKADGRVNVVELATGRTVQEVNAGRRLSTLAFTPDGQTLVWAEIAAPQQEAGPRLIRRWDLAAGAALPPFDAGAAPV